MRGLLLAVLACVAVATVSALAGDQPQWGQRNTRNMASSEKGLPDSFDPATGRNIKWSVPLGIITHSTPVIANGKVLIGTNNGAPRDPRHQSDRGVLMCFDEKDGSFLWQLVVPKLEANWYADWPGQGICSTATVDGDRVYLLDNRGEVMCLDLNGQANGNDGPFKDEGRHMVAQRAPPMEVKPTDADIIWLMNLADLGITQHDAAHASVLVDGQFLYVNTCNGVDRTHFKMFTPDAPSLIVLDKATGRVVAKDDEKMGRRTIHCTWAGPALGEVNGRRLIFFGGGDAICYAFEALAQTGVSALRKIWSFDCDPAAPREDILKWQDNRQEGPSNIMGTPVFHNGRVYITAGGDYWHGKPQCWLKCIDATKTGDITKSGERWSYPLKRHCMSTPAVADGLVFITDCGRTIHCVDAETGKPYWTHTANGEFWSSPLVADGKVYVTSRSREFLVFAADKEKRLITSMDLGVTISASPVAANGVLYVATMDRLYAIQKSTKP